LFDILAADVASGQLPSVSWIPAPEAYTEHPAWPSGYGASYMAGVLNALTSTPEVWSRTVLLINWDENDGFFDHVVGPYPNVGTLPGRSTVPLDNELFDGTAGTPGGSSGVVGPYGLGVRVPLLAISPWSKGGWVCSEVFDHTSVIRFIEARFGVEEPNITPWRRAVCGDLTSAFDFRSASDGVPALPSVDAYEPDPRTPPPPPYHPVPPADGSVPTQERGVRPSRRLGYRLDVAFDADPDTLNLTVENHGRLGVHLQARSLTVPGAPYSYTIGSGDELTTSLPNPGTYDLSVHSPNGFFRHFAGSAATAVAVAVHADHDTGRLRLRLTADGNHHRSRVVVKIADAFGPDHHVPLKHSYEITIDTRHSGGWYDIALATPSDASFSYELAGRMESRAQLTSDPQLGRQ
jgi:phospholipase C